MFDREGFIDYVGAKSGNSYASGLARIENLYSVGIDAEYDKDKCEALLTQIEADKKRTDLDQKELKKRSDAASHLKRYITFKTNSIDTITDRIHFVIDHYKEHFDAVDQGERYKWEAIAWYKKHWKIDSPNFAQMLEEAFGKAKNLLASAMYYPYRMITEYARVNPEEVRRIFKILYDESLPLEERYQVFRDSCKSGVDQIRAQNPEYEKAVNHYQDLRAIMVYLTFEYPEKYYLYKSTMYSDFRDRIGFREDKSNQSSVIGKVENFFRLCEIILAEVEKDQELIAKHKARLDNDCYADEALHLLTMDIVYYGSNYMSDKDFKTRPSVSAETAYWPSLEEYNPGITTEMWKSVLCNPSVTSPENLDMLRKMLKLGGESTCAHLAETFGNTAGFYNALGTGFAGKVKKHFHCPDCIDPEDNDVEHSRVYVVPFIGRYIMENGNKRYSWRLREELKEALMYIDLPHPPQESVTDVGRNTILYGPPGTGKTYHTVIYAVAIIENKELSAVEKEDYAEVLERYNEYKTQGRIEFTTFHQSYGYEEFIEGIRPMITPDDTDGESGEIQYSVQPGVFKRFCNKADENWRIFKRCIDELYESAKKNDMKLNISGFEVPVSENENRNGNCWVGDDELYNEWCRPTTNLPVFAEDEIRKTQGIQAIIKEIKSKYGLPDHPQTAGNYVFIIDEINRGNISKIFGELITLIEATKRVGMPEGMTVRLPYSQKPFGVPKNVYIIGTMNTADRSIATIDTALRRRFLFREMLPDPKVLADISVEDLSISELLTRLNKRITVLYDREHTIGHAYFMPLKASPTVETLAEIFTNNIVPLLQEYFYEDYEKIRLVLGDNRKSNPEEQFIVAKENDYAELFGDIEVGLDDGYSYEINDAAFGNIEAYRSI